ncbi:hypothetical protein ACMA1D_13565 [Streptomyces sp. 796.1]|uniref:hypothetical protein n=1 Tax=Streptomyces sp. 796.1 TaxID=3163029 RepID=UPI0039C9648F
MPPLQRTVGAAPLLTDPEPFHASLGTWQDASLTSTLGHLVSPDAPAGLGHGLTEPSEPGDPGSPLPAAAPDTAARPATPSPSTSPTGQPTTSVRHFTTGATHPPEPSAALQRMATEPLTSARPLETALLRELGEVREVREVGDVSDGAQATGVDAHRAHQPASADGGPGAAAVRAADSATVQRSMRPAGPADGTATGRTQGTPTGPGAAAGVRGVGLGAPLAGLPPTAQRTPAASTSAGPPPPGPSAEEVATGGGTDPTDASEPAAPPPTPEPTATTDAAAEQPSPAGPPDRPLLADAPLVARLPQTEQPAPLPLSPTTRAGGPPVSAPYGSAQPVDAGAPAAVQREVAAGPAAQGAGAGPVTGAVQRAPVPVRPAAADGTPLPPPAAAGPVRPVVAPLVAQRSVPLFSAPVREALGDDPRDAAAETAVPVQWSEPAGAAPAAAGAPAPTAGRPATEVQRWSGPRATVSGNGAGPGAPSGDRTSAGSGPVPLTAGSGPSGSTGQWASLQRAAAPRHSAPRPAASGRVESARGAAAGPLVDAGAVAVAAGVAQRMADGSVVFQRPAATLPTVVQRAADPDEPPPPEPPDTPSDPPPDPAGGPVTADDLAPGGDPAADGEPPAGAEQGDGRPADGGRAADGPAVTDALVRALFAPLSRLLKAELRLERERAGHLIETRYR